MPGSRTEHTWVFPLGTHLGDTTALLSFRDAAGVNWKRTPYGHLAEEGRPDEGWQLE